MRKYTTVDPQDGAFAGPSSAGYQTGVTKREYFAAMIMAAHCNSMGPIQTDHAKCALESVRAADALITELNKEVENVG